VPQPGWLSGWDLPSGWLCAQGVGGVWGEEGGFRGSGCTGFPWADLGGGNRLWATSALCVSVCLSVCLWNSPGWTRAPADNFSDKHSMSQAGVEAGPGAPPCRDPLPVPAEPGAAAWSGWGSAGPCPAPASPPVPASVPVLPRPSPCLVSFPALLSPPSLPGHLPCLISHFPSPRPCFILVPACPHPCFILTPAHFHPRLSPSLFRPGPCLIPIPIPSPSLPPVPIPAPSHPRLSPVPTAASPSSRPQDLQPRGAEVPVAGGLTRSYRGGSGPGSPNARTPSPGRSALRPGQSTIVRGAGAGGGRTFPLLQAQSPQNRDLLEKAETLPEPGAGALRRWENTCGKSRETEKIYFFFL